ncbi:hypothetical protein LIER_33838 [Lithospermum erythrorhizon]|uniref:Uncharacterized protein n=1 Tax=Lithospermum erythrorhizon TaxID=34254 RepID=A0AAV3S0A7_LITER
MSGPSEWPKTNKITLKPPRFVRQVGRPNLSRRKDITKIQQAKEKERLKRWTTQNCKYCGIGGHNVRTYAKKKTDTEAGGGCSEKNKEIADEEVIDPEQAAHEAYLYNLKDWFSEMNRIVPVIQAQPLMAPPQTSLQPTLAHPQEAPPQTPPHPTIQVEAPMKPRKMGNASKRLSQPVAKTTTILQKMKRAKGKSTLSQGG